MSVRGRRGRQAPRGGTILVVLCLLARASSAADAPAGAPTPAPATPDVLTLEEALALARQHNVRVANAGLDVEKAEREVAAAKTHHFPKLDVSVLGAHHLTDESFRFRRGDLGTVPGLGPIPAQDQDVETNSGWTTWTSTGARLPIVGQYRIGLTVDQAKVAQEMAEEHLRGERTSTAKDVRDAYYDILEQEAALAATRQTIDFLRELDALVGRYVAQRVALEYERLDVQARLAKAEQEALKERNAIASGKERLNVLLGRDVDVPFEVSSVPAPSVDVPDEAAARKTALAQRPALAEARLKVEHAEYGKKITQAEYLPEVSVDVRYIAPYGARFVPSEQATVGVWASWDVFDWGRRYQQVQERAAATVQAWNTERNTRSQVESEVNERIRGLENARALLPAAALGERAAREKLRVTFDRYKQHDVLLDDVLQAEAKVGDAVRDASDARLAVWTAWAALQHALGEE